MSETEYESAEIMLWRNGSLHGCKQLQGSTIISLFPCELKPALRKDLKTFIWVRDPDSITLFLLNFTVVSPKPPNVLLKFNIPQ